MIDYYLLTKPGIVLGNLITFAAGFFLASHGQTDFGLFAATLLGLALVMASACVLNNAIDRHLDQKMERTKKRALAAGRVSRGKAFAFATILGLAGNWVLLTYTNGLAVAVTSVGFLVYVCLYSFLKEHTVYSTLIGSVAGAVPPVVGYCAVSGQLDVAAFLLFLLMVFWQMPHFFAIAIWHLEDYKQGGIPLLPVVRGVFRTKVQMALYVAALLPVVAMLTFYGYAGKLFLLGAIVVVGSWLVLSIRGFVVSDHIIWARQMFYLSLLAIATISFLLSIVYGK